MTAAPTTIAATRLEVAGHRVLLTFGPGLETVAEEIDALWSHLRAADDDGATPQIRLDYALAGGDLPAGTVPLPARLEASYTVSGHLTREVIRRLIGTRLLLHAGAVVHPELGTLVLVGPDALTPDEGERLTRAGVVRLGAKDRREVPGYLQHADVLVVPHVVDDFTDSLDPIKLYEYRAVGRPVVSTPVAGFRESAGPRLHVTGADAFPTAVRAAVPATDRFPTGADPSVPSWTERVREMRAVLERTAATDHEGDETATLPVPLSARIRLGHAVVQSIADRHFVDLLHIKGAALDPALIHPGRCASDVDVLVRPEHVSTLLRSLEAAGFTATGRFATSSPFEHSVTLLHPLWGHVDVHRLYPGISLSPQEAFERLWRGRARVDIAGRSCSVPEVSAQVLVQIGRAHV